MSVTKKSVYACNPSTNRGESTKLSGTTDGRIVYTNGKTVIIRDINNPTLAYAFSEHVKNVNVARISPSGYYCASAEEDGTVKIWDTSFTKSTPFPPTTSDAPIVKYTYKPLSGRIADLAWDGESKRLIVVGESQSSFGAAIQVDTGTTAGDISGHGKRITAVSIRHQRPFKAVTSSDDNTIVFHTGVPFKLEKTIKTHSNIVRDVQYSPNGDLFVSVGSDKKIFTYDGKTGDTKSEFTNPHTGSIMAVNWSADSTRLVTSSMDCTVKLWDVETSTAVKTWTLAPAGPGSKIAFQQVGNTWASDSKTAGIVSLSLGGDLSVFDERSNEPTKTIHGPQKSINTGSVAGNGTFFVGAYDGRVTAYDTQGNASSVQDNSTQKGQVVGLATVEDRVVSVDWTDSLRELKDNKFDGQPLKLQAQPKGVAASASTDYVITEDSVRAVEGGRQISSVPLKYKPRAIAVTSDGALVAIGGEDSNVYLYDAKLKEVEKLSGVRGAVSALAFSPDGTLLAAGGASGKIVVYDVTKDVGARKPNITQWAQHNARVTSLAWTADSKHCASGSLDTYIYIYSVATPSKNIPIKNAIPGGANVVAWLGETTVAGAGSDGCVRTWDVVFHK